MEAIDKLFVSGLTGMRDLDPGVFDSAIDQQFVSQLSNGVQVVARTLLPGPPFSAAAPHPPPPPHAHTPRSVCSCAFFRLHVRACGAARAQVELLPGGSDVSVTTASLDEFVRLSISARVLESKQQAEAIRQGFNHVVPMKMLSLFSWCVWCSRVFAFVCVRSSAWNPVWHCP